MTFYALFFIHHAARRALIAGVTTNPDTPWMMQIARNVTIEGTGFLNGMKYLIHDGDSKFCPAFDRIIESAGVDLVPLPPKSPNLNVCAERFVLTMKSECLWRLLVFGEEGRGPLEGDGVRTGARDAGADCTVPDRTGPPAGAFNLVSGDGAAASALIDSPEVDGLSFAGRSSTRRLVAAKCVAANKRYQAVGGAKNHLVVMPDYSKMDELIRNMSASCCGCAGQRCMASSAIVAVGCPQPSGPLRRPKSQ